MMIAKRKMGLEKPVTAEKKNVILKTLQKPPIWKFLVKAVLGALFFIFGFSISYSRFFFDNPIFGIRFLAETLIGLAAGVFGYHTIPILGLRLKEWTEYYLSDTVSKIVNEFWDQQSKKISDARREKQKAKNKELETKNKEILKSSVLLDTSVLIDGRVLDIAKTGFFDFEAFVPQSVIDELHLVSDSPDDLKRQRGRRGLDMLGGLKKLGKVKIFTDPGDISKKDGVDKELIRLAKKYKMKLMTLDFNLNKVAKATGIDILNLNELGTALKAVVLPGETLEVKIVQKGKEDKQGVGYFPDGTMIVVEGGGEMLNKKINATVSRIIQTEAGKMVFCVVNPD
uniref:PIN domain-containing protein n=1 Tax=candidate division WWE3 bacterium TaxID=2053526 RepID=A0A7C4XTJ7_UNCKA